MRYPVSSEKELSLLKKMEELEICEEDLLEKFIRGSGKGGQKINKTSSCVYLLHRTTGLEVKCQKTRSQALNRFHARRELCDKVESLIKGIESKKTQEIEKIRRQKKRRTRKQKEKMLVEKKKTSALKASRKKPKDAD